MELVRGQFGLHPLAVEDALNPNQMPKVEIYGKQLFIVARTAAIEEGERIDYGQTAIFLGHGFHRHRPHRFGPRPHCTCASGSRPTPSGWRKGRISSPMRSSTIVVDGYQPIMDKLETAVQTMEERAIEAFPDPATIRRIFRLRRQLRRFERIVGPMEEVCERLATHDLARGRCTRRISGFAMCSIMSAAAWRGCAGSRKRWPASSKPPACSNSTARAR